MTDESSSGRLRVGQHALVIVALYVLAFFVRDHAARHRISAGHGDVAAYYHVSKNLFEGRGFQQDFIADFLQDPESVPAPSNTWWLPLPSIIAWAGMEWAGEPTFVAAKRAMIAVASLVAPVCYLTGLFLLGSWLLAVGVGLLGVGFHLYLDQPTVTLSHGPYSVFASAALLCVLAYPRHRGKVLPWFGLCFGLTYLCRGDSQVLVASLGATMFVVHFLGKRPRPAIPWLGIVGAAALFLCVAAPWWVRNVRAIGEMMPSGVKKVMYAKNYEEWFSDPSILDKETYLEWGWDNILEQKRKGVVDALVYTPVVMHRSVVRAPVQEEVVANEDHSMRRILYLSLYALTPLLALGCLWLLVRRPWVAVVLVMHLAMLTVVYGVIFPGVGRESYRSSLFSVFPLALTMIVAAVGLLFWPLRSLKGARVHGVAALVVAAVLGLANVWAAEPHLRSKAGGVEDLLAPFRHFGQWWRKNDGPDAVFFVRNPWQFTAETGLRSVMLPNVSADKVLEYADRFGVQYLLDEGSQGEPLHNRRPGAARMIDRGDVVHIPNAPVFKLYRILPR